MESKAVCPDRSWQSMKERFNKHIIANLDKFKVTKTQLVKADKDKANAPTRKTASDQAGSSRRPFTRSEDEAILRHILTNEDYSRVGGNKMWTEMEKVVGGRSWQSLKERFRKKIMGNLRSFSFLTKEQRLSLEAKKKVNVAERDLEWEAEAEEVGEVEEEQDLSLEETDEEEVEEVHVSYILVDF